MTSSITGNGIIEIKDEIFNFVNLQKKLGFFEKKRNQQKIQWFKEKIELEIYDFISKNLNSSDILFDIGAYSIVERITFP